MREREIQKMIDKSEYLFFVSIFGFLSREGEREIFSIQENVGFSEAAQAPRYEKMSDSGEQTSLKTWD